jgi:hypothetical protein
VTFRQSATDADNRVRTSSSALHAQDQIELSRFVDLVGGVPVDRFAPRCHNNRGETLGWPDTMVSPRAGVVLKPVPPLSLCGSYSVSHMPSSGDQFHRSRRSRDRSSPRGFSNCEVGARWDLRRRPALARRRSSGMRRRSGRVVSRIAAWKPRWESSGNPRCSRPSTTASSTGSTGAAAALQLVPTEQSRLHVNVVENFLDARCFVNANSNTNISPGSPRTVRVGIMTAT